MTSYILIEVHHVQLLPIELCFAGKLHSQTGAFTGKTANTLTISVDRVWFVGNDSLGSFVVFVI